MTSHSSDGWQRFAANVATTHRVEKYDGFQLTEENLEQMAEILNAGGLPMIGHHDWAQPVATRNVVASVIETEDGEKAVRLECEVQSTDMAALGEVRAMSFTTFALIGRVGSPHPNEPELMLRADAAAFDERDIIRAAELMSEVAPVEASFLYQFNAVETARFVLELGYNLVQVLGPNLASSAIWDGARHLLSHRNHSPELAGTTRIELVTPVSDGREVIGLIDTPDSDVARLALETYSRALDVAAATGQHRAVMSWDNELGQWDNEASDQD